MDNTLTRDTWSNKLDFFFALLGVAVGLGNIWRFPFLCYMNGGGAFLIPYCICLFIGGIPVYFLEVSLGQFMSVGGLKTWDICPLFKGIYGAVFIMATYTKIFYNIIMAWSLYYLFSSFTTILPWATCGNSWNTQSCVQTTGKRNSSILSDTIINNLSSLSPRIDPSTEFWERKVLSMSYGIEEVGVIKWDIALCLLLTWIVVFMCVWKGIKTSGKVVYFTALSPYVFIIVLLIRGVTLPGALTGIKYYLYPNFTKLTNIQIWLDASTQVFYSIGIGFGVPIAMASYNNYHYNCWRDCWIISVINGATSFGFGFVVFSTLGFMAQQNNVTIDDVAESGPGLVFIVYPKAIAQMPLSPFWSVLFFLMLILIGIDTQILDLESSSTAIFDQFPLFFNKRYKKQICVFCMCIFYFLCGLSLVTNGGIYLFHLLSYYAINMLVILIGLLECVAITYAYGVNRFYTNLQDMLGFNIGPYMKYSWLITAPLCLLVTFILYAYNFQEIRYNKTYVYPRWAVYLGWFIMASSIVMVPIFAIVRLTRSKGTLLQRLKLEIQPIMKIHNNPQGPSLNGTEEINCLTDSKTIY